MMRADSEKPSLLSAAVCFFPGLVFECIVRARNRLYDESLLAQSRLPHPVVSIGNLTVGGTGKTPLVVHVAQTVARLGANPVLLSRGYGRTGKSAVILPPGASLPLDPALIGDEPALMRKREPQLWLGISPDRGAVARQIAHRQSSLIYILDDGFQHRRVKRDLDIVVIDRTQPLAGNRMLPRGTLREPPAGLRRAGLIVLNGSLEGKSEDPLERLVRRSSPRALVFHCVQQIERLIPFREWLCNGVDAEPCATPGSAYLVAAIGNPGRFRTDVRSLGIELKGERFYRDHARLSHQEWLACAREAAGVGAASLITTEKDAVKIPGSLDIPLLVAVQSTQLAEQAGLEQRLKDLLAGGR